MQMKSSNVERDLQTSSREARRQMVYQRGNQREGSPHYVLLYSDDENSGDEESIPMHPRVPSTSFTRTVEVINVTLKPEDTLQALALRYRCTISELKRINKIHKENEIYAHRVIKVPVHPFSILTEGLDQNHAASKNEQEEPCQNEESVCMTEKEPLVNLVPVAAVTEPVKAEINAIILNSVCEPLSSYSNANSVGVNDTESDQLLPSQENDNVETNVIDMFKCPGDDCGLTWTQLVGVSLLLGGSLVLLYTYFI